MNRRALLQSGLASLAAAVPAQQSVNNPEGVLNAEITRVLELVKQIRPGDLRKSLERDWKQDGGLQVSSQTRYLLKSCATIMVDVGFRQVDVTRPFDNPDDIVTHVSKPYLDYPAYD